MESQTMCDDGDTTHRYAVTFRFGRGSPSWSHTTNATSREDAIQNARSEYNDQIPNATPPQRISAYRV